MRWTRVDFDKQNTYKRFTDNNNDDFIYTILFFAHLRRIFANRMNIVLDSFELSSIDVCLT